MPILYERNVVIRDLSTMRKCLNTSLSFPFVVFLMIIMLSFLGSVMLSYLLLSLLTYLAISSLVILWVLRSVILDKKLKDENRIDSTNIRKKYI